MKLPALALVALLQAAGSGGCQPPSPDGPAPSADQPVQDDAFAAFDVTQNGALTGTEIDACACSHYDADGDGEITRAEFAAGASDVASRETAPGPVSPGACASVGGARLHLAKASVAPREPMPVGFARPEAEYMDNVEVHQVYPGGSEMISGASVWGESEGMADLTAPGAPGRYEVRYVASGSGETLACLQIEVAAVRVDAPSASGAIAEGVYETYFHGHDGMMNKWLAGDIEILPGGRYSFQGEAGRYGYDPGSGRVVWTGGGLDRVYAVLRESDGRSAIVIPRAENQAAGRDLAVSDVWGYLRR